MRDFDELAQFLAHWYDCDGTDFGWDGILPDWLQSDVREFYRRFGVLTQIESRFSARDLASPFAAQDQLVPVEELTKRDDGAVILLFENQGCWSAGQMPESKNLWCSIDLELGDTPPSGTRLFDMGMPLKEALTTHALHETVMSSVGTGPAFTLEEWQSAEDELCDTGTTELMRYITPGKETLRISRNDKYLASNWVGEVGFTWIVRRGDRQLGARPTHYPISKPN